VLSSFVIKEDFLDFQSTPKDNPQAKKSSCLTQQAHLNRILPKEFPLRLYVLISLHFRVLFLSFEAFPFLIQHAFSLHQAPAAIVSLVSKTLHVGPHTNQPCLS